MYSEDPCEQKPFKILGENGAWAYPGTIQIFWVPPIISGTGKAMNFKLGGYIHRVHPNKSPLKICQNRERGRIQGLPNFLKYPLLYHKWVQLRTSNLADIFRSRVRANKSQLKIWEKMERGRIQGLPKFFEYPLLSQERVKLRTSIFVRTFLVSIGTKVHYKFLEK